jgi:uncharacterized protein (TIGR02453 family)
MDRKIKTETIQFLQELTKNNNRDWFNDNKEKFVAANENFIQFIQSFIAEVTKFDKTVAGIDAKDTVFRIYRDIRFSKDKSPYKTHFAATLMGKGGGCGNAGYYFHLEPGASFLAGGLHMTDPAHLRAVREEISDNGNAFLKIINDKGFKELFKIEGEKLTKVPQGFEKEDPMAEYLKYKELVIHHQLSDKLVVSEHFLEEGAKICKAMVPFNSFLNAPLKSAL